MGALPPFRQFDFSQIPGAPPWFSPFLQQLNRFAGALYDIANKNTALGSNVPAQVFTITVATGPAGTFAPISFKATLLGKPQACLLAQVQLTLGTASNSAISLNQWTYQAGMIKVDALVGLATNATYNLTFLVF